MTCRINPTRELVRLGFTPVLAVTSEPVALPGIGGKRSERCIHCKPPYALNAFNDLAADVRAGIARIKADPHLLHRDRVRGFIFDVAAGGLNEVV